MTEPAILVADDDPACCELITHTLARLGYRTRTASSGAGALLEAARERPLAALIDINLPVVNGYEVCRALKERYDGLPVIFISGHRTEALDRIGGLMLGADDYVVKPFDPEELVARLRRLVAVPLSRSSGAVSSLTPREQEVIQLLVDGLTPAQVAQDLVIAPKTVSTHIQNILGKLEVSSRSQAIIAAVREGLQPRAQV